MIKIALNIRFVSNLFRHFFNNWEILKSFIVFWVSNNLIITSLSSFSSKAFLRIWYSGWKRLLSKKFMLLWSSQPGRSKRFISNVVLPHPDLHIIKPLIPLGSSGWLQRLLRFSFQARFLLPFLYLKFFIFPYIKMYCLKCRRVTETENITTATSKNGRLMRRSQCIICGKTKPQFVIKWAAGGSFQNTSVYKLPFEKHLPGHNFTDPGTKLYKRLNPDGTPKQWSIPINRVDNAAIITIYVIQNMMILKLGMRFVIRQCLVNWMKLWTQH